MICRGPLRVGLMVVGLGCAQVCSAAQGADPAKPRPAKPAAARAPANANPLPGADEIRKSFEDGNYKETLQKLSRVLALRGDAARVYDRHALLRLKAEAQLKLKDASGAAASFEQAAREAPDDRSRAVDVATQMVVRRSKNLSFTPAPKRNPRAGAKAPRPIDVSEPEKRQAAFAALLAEQKDQVAPRLAAAKNARTLAPVAEALQSAGRLRTLELAATGDDAQVKAMVRDLSGRAQKMMADAVGDMTQVVKDVEESASTLKEVMVPVRTPGLAGGGVMMERSYKKRGLMTPDVNDLRRVIADCRKLIPAARDLGEKLGEAGEAFKQIGKDAAAVGNKAHEVLTADYADSYPRSPRRNRR